MKKMNRMLVIFTISGLLLTGVGVGLNAAEYALYYACTDTQDTALVIMNSGGKATYYTIKVYDAYGTLLEAASGDLNGYESDYQVLSDLVGTGDTNWGLAIVESPGILTIGIETFVNGGWQASENVTDPVNGGNGATYYWYGLNYANTADQASGVAVVNPYDSPVAGTLFVYDSFGNQVDSTDILLDPHESDYFALRNLVSQSDSMWGVIDIKATAPIIVAGEYFAADGTLLNVDEITRFYYSE